MFVEIKVNKMAAFAMVDTDSTVTIISEDLAKLCVKPEDIHPRDTDISLTSGNPMDLAGEARFKIRLGHHTTEINVVIARNFGKAALLGVDYLMKSKANVNYYTQHWS